MISPISAALQPFLGTWRLGPGESRYEFGRPPLDGEYTLSWDGPHLHFDIQWTTPDGASQSQSFDAIPDGQPHPYDSPAVDSLCVTLVDEITLDSTASKSGQVVAHARRVLLGNAMRMTVVQSGKLPDGTTFANHSLYHRVATAEQSNLLLLERFNRALNAHDVPSMMALMSVDCVFENTYPPPDGERIEGQAAVTAFWQQFFTASPAANIRIEELIAAGDRAVQRWIYRWDAHGHVRGVDVFRIEDGKIAEKLSYVKG